MTSLCSTAVPNCRAGQSKGRYLVFKHQTDIFDHQTEIFDRQAEMFILQTECVDRQTECYYLKVFIARLKALIVKLKVSKCVCAIIEHNHNSPSNIAGVPASA